MYMYVYLFFHSIPHWTRNEPDIGLIFCHMSQGCSEYTEIGYACMNTVRNEEMGFYSSFYPLY